MKSLLRWLLVLLLTAVSFGAGAHVGAMGASAVVELGAADDGEEAPADCCAVAGHEVAGPCIVLGDFPSSSPDMACGALEDQMLRPAAAPVVATIAPETPRKPPRTERRHLARNPARATACRHP